MTWILAGTVSSAINNVEYSNQLANGATIFATLRADGPYTSQENKALVRWRRGWIRARAFRDFRKLLTWGTVRRLDAVSPPISDPRPLLIEPLRLAGAADNKRKCRVAIEVERFGSVRGRERGAIRSERNPS